MRIVLAAAMALAVALTAVPAEAGKRKIGFHPLRTVKQAANLGLDTARGAVNLGVNTASGAVNVAKDAVSTDRCPTGHRYRGRDHRWHTCR